MNNRRLQGESTGFVAYWGGHGSDTGGAIKRTPDGGFVVAGNATDSLTGYSHATISKFNADGDIVWEGSFGSAGSNDYGLNTCVTAAGDIYLIGQSYTYYIHSSYPSSFVQKWDADGDLLWTNAMEVPRTGLGVSTQTQESWVDCQEGSNNNIRLLGKYWKSSDDISRAVVAEIQPDGDLEYANFFKNPGDVLPESLQVLNDDASLVFGHGSFDTGYGSDVLVYSTNSDRDTGFAQKIGGEGNEYAYASVVLADGGSVLVGETDGVGSGGGKALVIRLTASGETVWMRYYGGEFRDYAHGIAATLDGNVVIIGTTWSYGLGGSDVLLFKVNVATGLPIWSKSLGGIEDDVGLAVDVEETGSIIVTGKTKSSGFGPDHEAMVVARVSEDGVVHSCSTDMQVIDLGTSEITNFRNFNFAFDAKGSGSISVDDKSDTGSGIAVESLDLVCDGVLVTTIAESIHLNV